MNEGIKKCPCEKDFEELCIELKDGGKRALVSGTCCDEWRVEFSANGLQLESPELLELAVVAWNQAPRFME